MKATLYAISISHPSRAAGLMLRHKGIEADIVNIAPGSQQVLLRAQRFRHGTVPALKIDGRRIQGSREISRALEELKPEPPLFPSDPGLRTAVEDAERWGERVYQPVPRKIFRWAASSDADLREELARRSGFPAPSVAKTVLWPVAQLYMRFENGGEATARGDVGALPDHIDHVDRLIEQGVIGGEELNAADYQIGTTTRVLLNFDQLRPLLEGRPAADHGMRIAPGLATQVPVRVPADWISAADPR